MKKILCSFLCVILIFSALSIFGMSLSDVQSLPSRVQALKAAYDEGEYGDEVYQLNFEVALAISDYSATVAVKDGEATLCFVNIYGERSERKLSQEEFQKLTSFVSDNGVDELEDWISYNVFDGVAYSYTHICGDHVSYVHMVNPEYGGEEGAVYADLAMLFRLLVNPALKPDVESSEEITVRVNGFDVNYPVFTDNGHTHIGKDFATAIGAECGTTSAFFDMYYTYLFRGSKLIVMPVGKRYMVLVDATGYDSLDALIDDMGGSVAIREKSCYEIIPLNTTVVNGYIPLRAVCEAFGGDVNWNGEAALIDVNIEENITPNISYLYLSYIPKLVEFDQSLVIM